MFIYRVPVFETGASEVISTYSTRWTRHPSGCYFICNESLGGTRDIPVPCNGRSKLQTLEYPVIKCSLWYGEACQLDALSTFVSSEFVCYQAMHGCTGTWFPRRHQLRSGPLVNQLSVSGLTICFTICLFISPDLDGMFGHRAPKTRALSRT